MEAPADFTILVILAKCEHTPHTWTLCLNMKLVTLIPFCLVLLGCSSSQSYVNALNSSNARGRFIFTLEPSSDNVRIVKRGPHRNETRDPNNREIFRISLNEIAKETKLNIEYYGELGLSSEQATHVSCELMSAEWIFTLSSATMVTKFKYIVEGKEYFINGEHKNMTGGTKSNNLLKSIINANYKFLIQVTNQVEPI
ncbi:MAG: hypothetical protein RIF46_05910 [Cyclobacteriaceae bacterium]